MTTINALLARGIAVPQQVPVVGYDDVELARHLHPSLSTIRQSIEAGVRCSEGPNTMLPTSMTIHVCPSCPDPWAARPRS
jgi:hypothetical protein